MKLKDLELKYAGEKLLLSGKQLRRQRELNENLKEEERYWNGQFEKLKEFGKEVLEKVRDRKGTEEVVRRRINDNNK